MSCYYAVRLSAFAALCVVLTVVLKGMQDVIELPPILRYPGAQTSVSTPSQVIRTLPPTHLNRTSCSCPARGSDLRNSVPEQNLGKLLEHRAEEYRVHQLRTKTVLDKLIFAQPNSPLQYPIQGFTVAPLKSSIIPGLAVYAQKRGLYKVSLSVSIGVLSVGGVMSEDQVEGQGANKLSITALSLDRVNTLLQQVSYKSNHYHIKTGDLAHFTFERYEAIFPIVIKRPTIPVLYDPGNDLRSQVTIITKTFLRYPELNSLIASIRTYYKDIKIIVADDSLHPQNVSGQYIEHYIMPPAQGWFAGRNLGVSQVTTKYFLWVDDDFLFTADTKIEDFVKILDDVPELDVVGGVVTADQFYFTLAYEEGNEEEGGCLTRLQNRKHETLPGYPQCSVVDGVVNFFMARTDSVRRVGFDPFLKRVAHSEFFMDGLGQLFVASCTGIKIAHQPRSTSKQYSSFRHQTSSDMIKKLVHHFFKNHLKCVLY